MFVVGSLPADFLCWCLFVDIRLFMLWYELVCGQVVLACLRLGWF